MIRRLSRVVLRAGHTLFLPGGWLHAVETTEDSIGFSGNFLRAWDVEVQLQIFAKDRDLGIAHIHTYPGFLPAMWYLLKSPKPLVAHDVKQKPRAFLACEMLKQPLKIHGGEVVRGITWSEALR